VEEERESRVGARRGIKVGAQVSRMAAATPTPAKAKVHWLKKSDLSTCHPMSHPRAAEPRGRFLVDRTFEPCPNTFR
jgi:hypothetical protein